MKRVLVLAAVSEAATGVALLVAPSLVGRLLLGEELTGVAIPVALVTGIALIALGVGCWPGPSSVGMLTYSASVTLYLAYVGFAGGLTGILLWPAVVLHMILTALLARMRNTLAWVMALCLLVGAVRAPAAEADDTESKLAKETQNPVANLISVPFQNNFNFNTGTKDATQWVLNVQPVIPIPISDDWMLITRTIMPIINQPELFSAGPRTEAFGLGDINPTLFLSPRNPGKFIWGVGPTMTFPTATVSRLGSGRFSAGPSVVGLYVNGPWVVGALANQQWDFAGWSNTHVNAMLVQPFVNYNFSHGWYLTTAPLITANWSASGDNHWTVPVGGGGGKLWRVGKVGLPVNTQLQAFYNAETPEFGPDWQLRAQVQFLFPR